MTNPKSYWLRTILGKPIDLIDVAKNSNNDPVFGKFRPENPNKLRKIIKECKDLTLYPCKTMNAKITKRSCALFQLYGREECLYCQNPITRGEE